MPTGLRFIRAKRLQSIRLGWLLCACLLALPQARAVDVLNLFSEAPTLERARVLVNAGKYEEAIDYTQAAQELDPWVTDWEILKAESLFALGQYEKAYVSLDAYVKERSYEIRPRLLLRQAALYTGRSLEAERQKDALGYLVNERSRRYAYDPENVVAIGHIALLFDVEPKLVLENFFRRAQEFSSKPVSAFLGTGNLALSKDDFKLASKAFQEGLLEYPDHVELLYGLACAYEEGDRSQLINYAQQALAINPRHAATLVLLAEHFLAAESFEAAEQNLDAALQTNPRHPDALALKATLAYLRNDSESGDTLRAAALSSWPGNPGVDYRIGKQLSRKYRFSDGASHQRIALGLDETFNPARIQLAQDLLRLGRNEEAWPLADAVHEADPYNISAYNLVTLRDRLQDFETIESERFLIRMSKEEAPVYGQRALRVLEDAHARLTQRYGLELPQKTTVEIYPNPADFETRTFGVPGNPGFLGVCFGPVFTINSPSTRAANWEAVLFHEFCHTITLHLTNNRMPRWLSEGISVYEEQEANPAWGQRMSASYRNRILSGQMQPISSMSSAFLQAEDGEDIQFAYYQSYLVIEYIAQNFGLEPLRHLLVALGEGVSINDGLEQHLAPLAELDEGFAAFARQQASELASDYRFDSASGPLGAVLNLASPQKNYSDSLDQARQALEAENWNEAIELLSELVETAGYLPGQENAHWPLAQAYRGIGYAEQERTTLEDMLRHEANRLPPVTRLLELAKESGDPRETFKWSNAWLAINPMAETPWRALLDASRSLDHPPRSIEAVSALLALKTPDRPSLHFQMAKLTQESDPEGAKRHVLQALADAPRFAEAYELLRNLQLQIAQAEGPDPLEALDLNNDFVN
ncbi:tetratricopeptide repeat protein [Pelagicoccus sp. SDUM812005]|uniref:tetratricopeptide repeat protein n=1 Tax=Pelagicoccus sp. SDUM812005 TaxID=3041257 RepID=UPI00280D9C7D|nr:tetratricopeptide repeat protein [Pelagicoccus sp. SDUM812005]MDQ8181668.1 peptidase MA family metallohydrolase [Pelagicoccus sp. SDUM812005]